jgi:hypothetical protein
LGTIFKKFIDYATKPDTCKHFELIANRFTLITKSAKKAWQAEVDALKKEEQNKYGGVLPVDRVIQLENAVVPKTTVFSWA